VGWGGKGGKWRRESIMMHAFKHFKRGKFNIALLANDLMKIHDGKRLGHLQLTNAWTSKQAAWLWSK
jgi:hypothetical protein